MRCVTAGDSKNAPARGARGGNAGPGRAERYSSVSPARDVRPGISRPRRSLRPSRVTASSGLRPLQSTFNRSLVQNHCGCRAPCAHGIGVVCPSPHLAGVVCPSPRYPAGATARLMLGGVRWRGRGRESGRSRAGTGRFLCPSDSPLAISLGHCRHGINRPTCPLIALMPIAPPLHTLQEARTRLRATRVTTAM